MAIKKILIVDDSPTERHFLGELLTKHGFQIMTLESGEEAVAKAADLMPDLILMDVVMPEKNGIEALCEIKASQPTVEVIMVTSNSDPETVQESIQNGACGFIIKPFNSARVLDTLEKIGARLRQKKP